VNSAPKGEVKATRVDQPNRGDVCNIPTCKNKKARAINYQPISSTAKRNAKKKLWSSWLGIGDQLTESDPSNI
jgi:hypothetical protein